jgi:hypothetical protein
MRRAAEPRAPDELAAAAEGALAAPQTEPVDVEVAHAEASREAVALPMAPAPPEVDAAPPALPEHTLGTPASPAPDPPAGAAPASISAPEPASPSAPPEGPAVENLDADLDDDDDGATYESLVALVASLPDENLSESAPASGERADRAAETAEEIEIVDLDQDEGGEAVERLIANAVVGAPVEAAESEPEAPLIDLDADEPRAPVGAPAGGPTPTASAEATRLALAAARGGVDEDDVTSFSVDDDDVSTPEARARLLAAALAHAEHQEARYRVPTESGAARRWKALAASLVFVLAGWVAAAPVKWVQPEPPARLDATTRARGIRTALLLQAQQIEAFRVEAQRLPTDLGELPARLPGLVYARSGNRAYQLIGYEPDGDAIIYDSTDPLPAFRTLIDAWAPPEGAP